MVESTRTQALASIRSTVADALHEFPRDGHCLRKRQMEAEVELAQGRSPTDVVADITSLTETYLHARRSEELRSIVPASFLRPLDYSKLVNPEPVRKVMSWWKLSWLPPNPTREDEDFWDESQYRGILAFGPTGLGKTRSLLARLSEQYLEGGLEYQFRFVRIVDLAAKVNRLAPRHGEELVDYIEELLSVPYLMLDDIHQAKLTPRYAAELFRIVDVRTSEVRHTFVTCQMKAGELIRKFAADNPGLRANAESVVRRLGEHCHPIEFSYPSAPAK